MEIAFAEGIKEKVHEKIDIDMDDVFVVDVVNIRVLAGIVGKVHTYVVDFIEVGPAVTRHACIPTMKTYVALHQNVDMAFLHVRKKIQRKALIAKNYEMLGKKK